MSCVTCKAEEATAQNADEILASHERIILSERDFAAFVEAINGLAEPPTERLLADVAAYKERHAKEIIPAQ